MEIKEIQKIKREVKKNLVDWRKDKPFRIGELLSQLMERIERKNDKQYCAAYTVQLHIKDAILTAFCDLIRENEKLKEEIVRDDGK